MILSFITKNKYIIIPILINILILLGLLAVVIISGADYHKILLMGDSYYDIAKDFFYGDTLLHKFRGPILPLIYSILFVFPQSIHPFVRLFISMIFFDLINTADSNNKIGINKKTGFIKKLMVKTINA